MAYSTGSQPVGTQSGYQPEHRVGETKVVNGVTYTLSESHRWTRDEDNDGESEAQGDKLDQPGAHAQHEHELRHRYVEGQLKSIDPKVAGVIRAFHSSPEYKAGTEPYVEESVHPKLAGEMFAMLSQAKGGKFGGGQVVDAGDGKLAFASPAGSLVVFPKGDDGKHRVLYTTQTGIVSRGAGLSEQPEVAPEPGQEQPEPEAPPEVTPVSGRFEPESSDWHNKLKQRVEERRQKKGSPVPEVAPANDDWPEEQDIQTEPEDTGDGDLIGVADETAGDTAPEAPGGQPDGPEEIIDAEPADVPTGEQQQPQGSQSQGQAGKPPRSPEAFRDRADAARSKLDAAVEEWDADIERGADTKTQARHRSNVASLRAIWRHHEQQAKEVEAEHGKRQKESESAKQKARKEAEKAAKEKIRAASQVEKAAQQRANVGSTKASSAELRQRDNEQQRAKSGVDEPRPLLDVPEGQGSKSPEPAPDPLAQAALTMPKPQQKTWNQLPKHFKSHGMEASPANKTAIMDGMKKGVIKSSRHAAAVLKAAAKIKQKLINQGYEDEPATAAGSGAVQVTKAREPVDVAAIKKAISRLDRRQEAHRESWKAISEQKSDEYGMSPQDFEDTANELFKDWSHYRHTRETAKASARKLSGLTAGRIAKLENKGYDNAKAELPDLAAIGRNLAGQYKDLGWGGGYGGEGGDRDYGALVWDLIREGAKKHPSKTDPEFIGELDKYLGQKLGMGGSGGGEGEIDWGAVEDESITEADRRAYEEATGRKLGRDAGEESRLAELESVPFQKRLRSGFLKWYYARHKPATR